MIDAPYSIKNKMRILKTHPNASVVRCKSDWRKLGREVLKGAPPAWIIAPIAFNTAGDPVAFKECPVYDITHTEPVEDLDQHIQQIA